MCASGALDFARELEKTRPARKEPPFYPLVAGAALLYSLRSRVSSAASEWRVLQATSLTPASSTAAAPCPSQAAGLRARLDARSPARTRRARS